MTYQNLQDQNLPDDDDNVSKSGLFADMTSGGSITGDTRRKNPGKNPGSGLPGWLSGSNGLLIGLGLGLALPFLVSRVAALRGAPAEAPVEEAVQTASASVTAVRSQTRPVNTTITASGTVEAFALLAVSPRASGLQIQAVNVREGDRVTAGQVLAVLDDSVLQSQIEQAEAQVTAAIADVSREEARAAQARASLAEAEEQLSRYNSLFAQGAISAEELTTRRTQVTTAEQSVGSAVAEIASAEATVRSRQADVSRLTTQLDQTLVIAPASGIIAERSATAGDTASTSTPLFRIISGDQLELAVRIPQAQMARVAVGRPVQITSDSDADLQLQGRIQSIDPTVDPQTRQATVKVALPGSDRLRPGMFLNAAIVTGTRQGVVIPADAVLPQSSGGFVVYTLSTTSSAGNTGEEQVTTANARSEDEGNRIPGTDGAPAQIELLSGLDADERVVIEGASYLQDGDVVSVVEGGLE